VRLAAFLLGLLGAALGLIATWLVAASGDTPPRLIILATASCALTLAGGLLARHRRPRLLALLLVEGAVGLALGIGEAALIPGAVLLLAAALAWLGR
jgi:hypothetical protein